MDRPIAGDLGCESQLHNVLYSYFEVVVRMKVGGPGKEVEGDI